MKLLRDDSLRLLRRKNDRVRSRLLGVGFFSLVALGAVLFGSSVMYRADMSEVRNGLEGWAAPGLTGALTITAPVRNIARKLSELSSYNDEIQRLRQENVELRGWQWRATELERKLSDLRALAKVVRKPGVGFVTAQILSVSPGPAVHSILINVGSKHGLQVGDAVINGDGLVGVVESVLRVTARVSLLDDPGTSLDVSVGREGVLGRLVGEGSGLARLQVVNSEQFVRAGDKVVTSGKFGGVPRGLKVGMIVQEDGGMKIAPYAALGRLEYVSVLLAGEQRRSSAISKDVQSRSAVLGERLVGERAFVETSKTVGKTRETRVVQDLQ